MESEEIAYPKNLTEKLKNWNSTGIIHIILITKKHVTHYNTRHYKTNIPWDTKRQQGLEAQCFLLLQTSKDMFEPEYSMLYEPLSLKISGAEFQYPAGNGSKCVGR